MTLPLSATVQGSLDGGRDRKLFLFCLGGWVWHTSWVNLGIFWIFLYTDSKGFTFSVLDLQWAFCYLGDIGIDFNADSPCLTTAPFSNFSKLWWHWKSSFTVSPQIYDCHSMSVVRCSRFERFTTSGFYSIPAISTLRSQFPISKVNGGDNGTIRHGHVMPCLATGRKWGHKSIAVMGFLI